jgi:hypothetical protein
MTISYMVDKVHDQLMDLDMWYGQQLSPEGRKMLRSIIDTITASDPDNWFDSIEAYNRTH